MLLINPIIMKSITEKATEFEEDVKYGFVPVTDEKILAYLSQKDEEKELLVVLEGVLTYCLVKVCEENIDEEGNVKTKDLIIEFVMKKNLKQEIIETLAEIQMKQNFYLNLAMTVD